MITQESIRSLIRREELGSFLNQHAPSGVGLEVGTYKGEFCAHLASQWTSASTIHTCDPWLHYPEYTDGCVLDWANNKAPANMADFKAEAYKRLEPFKNVRIHEKTGVGCISGFIDGALSLCYLDGNHSYDAVSTELRVGWNKVERGGILGGHDCYDRSDSEQVCGVWRAVWEFAHVINQRPHLTNCTSFWFVKP